MRLAIHPAAFLGGAVVLAALILSLRPPPAAEPPPPQRAARATPPERDSISLDAAVLARYVGKYAGRGGFTIELALDKGRLVAQSPGSVPFELLAASPTEFFLKGLKIDVKFRFDDRGAVSGFVADSPYGPVYVDRVR